MDSWKEIEERRKLKKEDHDAKSHRLRKIKRAGYSQKMMR